MRLIKIDKPPKKEAQIIGKKHSLKLSELKTYFLSTMNYLFTKDETEDLVLVGNIVKNSRVFLDPLFCDGFSYTLYRDASDLIDASKKLGIRLPIIHIREYICKETKPHKYRELCFSFYDLREADKGIVKVVIRRKQGFYPGSDDDDLVRYWFKGDFEYLE